MRGLVPLLRRCLELVVWLAVAALVLLQLPAVAGLAPFGPRLIEVVGIVFVARVGAELVNLFVDRGQSGQAELSELERQQRATLIPLVKSFLRGVVYFIAVVLILGALDLNPLPLLAGAGVVGVVVGLGAQAVITDLVSGFFILVESQFLVGDYIETGTARGLVEAIQLRTTRIRDPNGQQHIVRNGQITGVVNHSKTYTFAVVEVDVPYDADVDRVYGLIRSVGDRFAEEHADVLEPTAINGVEQFSKSGLQVRTTTKVKPGTHGQVARDLRLAIFEAFRAASLRLAG
jgi:small conductance mechanosensitive channel